MGYRWDDVAKGMPRRSGKECRERWEALGHRGDARVLAARALRKVVDGTRLDEPRDDASATGIGEESGPSGAAAKPVLRPGLAEKIIRDAIDVMQFEMDKLHSQKAFEKGEQ